jgi:hypothetical protein
MHALMVLKINIHGHQKNGKMLKCRVINKAETVNIYSDKVIFLHEQNENNINEFNEFLTEGSSKGHLERASRCRVNV